MEETRAHMGGFDARMAHQLTLDRTIVSLSYVGDTNLEAKSGVDFKKHI